MKLRLKKKNLELIIKDSLIIELRKIGENHYPNEFGGLLIGNYSNDFTRLTITNTILPNKFKGLPLSFERCIDGLENILLKYFEEEEKIYIGEWHTHPNGNASFSNTDLNAMINIEHCKTVYINNPILLIIGILNGHFKEDKFYLLDKNRLHEYE